MLIWCSIIEPARIVVERHDVPVAGVTDPITIAVLADIQCPRITQRERDIARRVNALHPDLILIPGDLWHPRGALDPDPRDPFGPIAAEYREFLRSLHAPSGVYFCPGNCEVGLDWRAFLEGTGITILDNSIARTTVRGRDVIIGGTELHWYTQAVQDTIDTLERTPDDGSIAILMAHKPDVILRDTSDPEDLRSFARIALVVAGHTHGGQVQLPLIGPPITFSDVPTRIAAGGLFPLDDDSFVCVSRGLGMERGQAPPIRFRCPPELTVLTFRALQTSSP